MAGDVITLAHGAGGRAMRELIAGEILALCDEQLGRSMEDAAELPAPGEKLVFTTDSFVVWPLEFPGGDIGKLAICGTVNDLAMRGARPLYASMGLIIEEGLELATLRRVLGSMGRAAREAGVGIVTGDTKVVEHGKADGLFISMAGIGLPLIEPLPSVARAEEGDLIIINGPPGEHGLAVLAARASLDISLELESDCNPLATLVARMLQAGAQEVHALRDPTRGGVAAALNEIAEASGVGLELDETLLPVNPAVSGACEILGLDPLEVANEGKLVAIVGSDAARDVLEAMRAHPLGQRSAIIGEVIAGERVLVRTALGTTRVLDTPSGELLPRIC